MAPKKVYFAFLVVFLLVFINGASYAADITLVKDCVDRYPVPSSSYSCGYGGITFTINNETTDGISNCTLSGGNLTEFWVAANAPNFFALPATAPAGANRIRCNVTSSRFVEKQFAVYGALLDAKVDVPSVVYMNSTISLKVLGVDYDRPDAAGGFSACWNFRDPYTGQVVAQWTCSNATTTYGVPPSLPLGKSQFVLLLQAQNYESLFKYVPVTIRNAPSFSSSIYPETLTVPTSGGRLHYAVSVRTSSPADLVISWSDGRLTLADGRRSGTTLHMDGGKTENLDFTFAAGAMNCESECPQQFSITITDQYGNSQQSNGTAIVTDRYTSSYSISPESMGKLTVQPGSEAKAEVAITNTGNIPDVYSAVLVGDASPYSSVSPSTLSLAAGGIGRVTVAVSGSSGLLQGQLKVCFSSRNRPLDQKCAAASVGLVTQELVSLNAQPKTLTLIAGSREGGRIDVSVLSAFNDTTFSGSVESGCPGWLNNTGWLSTSRPVQGKYTNNILVVPTEAGVCTVKITVRAQGPSGDLTKSATASIFSSVLDVDVYGLNALAYDISSNVTVLKSKGDILVRAGISEAFVSGAELNASSLADRCREDVAGEKYSEAKASCALAQSAVRNAMEVLDYGGQSVRVSKPIYISPIAILSAILVILAVGYLIVSAPPSF